MLVLKIIKIKQSLENHFCKVWSHVSSTCDTNMKKWLDFTEKVWWMRVFLCLFLRCNDTRLSQQNINCINFAYSQNLYFNMNREDSINIPKGIYLGLHGVIFHKIYQCYLFFRPPRAVILYPSPPRKLLYLLKQM